MPTTRHLRATEPVTLVSLYPQLLGTYGDTGNVQVLQRRLEWRDIPVRVVTVSPGDPIPRSGDVYLLGGGEDAAQTTACRFAGTRALRAAADAGAVVFAVCAGFQLLGTRFVDGEGTEVDGLGLLDAVTDRLPGPRVVGEAVTRVDLPGAAPQLVTGFENHQGRTRLGPGVRALGQVLVGTGNGDDGPRVDGGVCGRVVGTYLHGPVLARNPAFADLLLSWVTGPLAALDDGIVEDLHRARLRAAS